MYSFQYGGERSPTAWRPYLWPIKLIMCIGIVADDPAGDQRA